MSLRNLFIGSLVILTLGGCTSVPASDAEQSQATEALSQQKNAEVGMPGITNFTEARLVRMLYELRDQMSLSTYTYYVDMNGVRHELCQSVGYGIPYSVQFSNPQRASWTSSSGYVILPQPEPNGLWTPDGLSATWVMCALPEGTQGLPGFAELGIAPMYVEPEIIVSPFPLR